MANNKLYTVFQNLDRAITGHWDATPKVSHNNTYNFGTSSNNEVIYSTKDKSEYEKTKLELQQNAYLNNRWVKANAELSVQAFSGLNNVKLMYRDADLMDSFPEIGAALDIISEESCIPNPQTGNIINVYSKSDRIKSILEDLFVNRLDITVMASMIIRGMCKYGNQFMLLNIDNKNGIKGWRQLPVFNMERLENGIENPYNALGVINGNSSANDVDMSTKFVWIGEGANSQVPFRNWQIGHFRLLTDSIYLPYGCSWLNKARRHWRMLSLMEDMMLIYRLERSIERRVYKIYVGAIDDADVKAYVNDIANEFKRTPIIDPMTGQLDLRKNILPVHKDTPIPLLDGRTITIEELSKEFNDGKENYVYSIQDKTHSIVPGKVVWCGKNYTAEKLIKLNLDDDTYVIMAAEHEVIMRDGSKKRADELKSGESVMPYIKKFHNIQSVEWVDGDDVYCMTIEGQNGEQDRHNFAICSWNNDKTYTKNGIFVSNCADQDIFIPTRSENAPNPIDTLAPAQNLTAMDDIKFVQNKVLTALRIPKSFLNFEDAQGDGKNLALMDIRFTRTVNRVQQAFLMELTKIASIHLYLLGFEDELTNFSLTMNNPSTQAEQLEIENLGKKIAAMRDAVADPGTGIPMMSQTRALKEIMKWSDKEIQSNLEEIRLEKALAMELEKTSQIIKKTGIFDIVDKMYGEPGAEYQEDQQGDGQDGDGGPDGGGGMGMPPDIGGDDMGDLGEMGTEEGGDINGAEGEIPMNDSAPQGDDSGSNAEPPMESRKVNKKPLLTESRTINKFSKRREVGVKRATILDKSAILINEEFDRLIKDLTANDLTE